MNLRRPSSRVVNRALAALRAACLARSRARRAARYMAASAPAMSGSRPGRDGLRVWVLTRDSLPLAGSERSPNCRTPPTHRQDLGRSPRSCANPRGTACESPPPPRRDRRIVPPTHHALPTRDSPPPRVTAFRHALRDSCDGRLRRGKAQEEQLHPVPLFPPPGNPARLTAPAQRRLESEAVPLPRMRVDLLQYQPAGLDGHPARTKGAQPGRDSALDRQMSQRFPPRLPTRVAGATAVEARPEAHCTLHFYHCDSDRQDEHPCNPMVWVPSRNPSH